MSKINADWKVEPHGSLDAVGDGIWSVEGSITMPLGRFPRRMTVIRLSHGALAIWSPISLDDREMARLDALGPVGFLIVPNAGHRLDLKAWKDRYPNARIVAPPGAARNVAEVAPVDDTANVLEDPGVALQRIAGTSADEFAVIVSRGDGVTLILNDILSSIRHPHGIGATILARLFGFGVDRPRTSRLIRHRYVDDPAAVARQFRTWAAIPNLRRLIVSHVDLIEDDPARMLETAAADLEK